MLQSRELDLALKPFLVHTSRHIGRQHFDDDLSVQPGFFGEKDTAHPATAQLPFDAICVAYRGLESLC